MKSFAASLLLLFPLAVVGTNHFAGVNAANSIGNNGVYTCRTQAQWNQVANDAKGLGMVAIRIVGFDCNALDLASSAAAQAGISVLAGLYISGTVAQGINGINTDVQNFRAAVAKYGAARYVGLTVGNEVQDSAANIMAKVYDVRGYLQSIGINVPVSTVHTWNFIRDNPSMCGADFAAANAHAFYDPPSTSSNANNFIANTVMPALRAACPGKTIRITESGWPSRGGQVGAGVASIGDELTALQGLNCAAQNVLMYAFEYDDQLWKSNDNERSFGMWVKIQGFANSC
ncbi:glycoside hydrolase superfamily [Mycena alexandri]|uniref:glucan endo-1,3-beta-D-glucosidase n=1 Tax=Mycena alexandri TaxID=1745969 RepID=A0AAD6S1V1_9AGAR|nr:glycoside hydrolase superfamily [Mycena alexandri]